MPFHISLTFPRPLYAASTFILWMLVFTPWSVSWKHPLQKITQSYAKNDFASAVASFTKFKASCLPNWVVIGFKHSRGLGPIYLVYTKSRRERNIRVIFSSVDFVSRKNSSIDLASGFRPSALPPVLPSVRRGACFKLRPLGLGSP